MDVLGGNVGWTPERTEILALTDPTQYFGNGITHKADQPMSTLADLENKRVATITGFSFIPELEKIPGIQLSFYDTSDAALRDLLAGRVEAVIADPPVMGYPGCQPAELALPGRELLRSHAAARTPSHSLFVGRVEVGAAWAQAVQREPAPT